MTEQEFLDKWEEKIMAHFCKISFDGNLLFWPRMKAIRKEFLVDARECYREGHKLPPAAVAPAIIPTKGATK